MDWVSVFFSSSVVATSSLAVSCFLVSLTGWVVLIPSASNPVAITVILISSFKVSSITAPNIILASISADSLTTSAAS